jgi:hypothetical protein
MSKVFATSWSQLDSIKPLQTSLRRLSRDDMSKVFATDWSQLDSIKPPQMSLRWLLSDFHAYGLHEF